MNNWFNSLFAKDRWEVIRIVEFKRPGDSTPRRCEIMCRNRYNNTVKAFSVQGYWTYEDFPEGTYTP